MQCMWQFITADDDGTVLPDTYDSVSFMDCVDVGWVGPMQACFKPHHRHHARISPCLYKHISSSLCVVVLEAAIDAQL